MTQEDKELLLQDLSARLPYGVKLQCGGVLIGETHQRYMKERCDTTLYSITEVYDNCYVINGRYDLIEVKPYLRPMSSMTEEERDEVEEISHGWFYINEDGEIYPMGRLTDCGEFEDAILPTFEYFLKNHIDYRCLIDRGLAIEAPEGMYN